jgi:hypothetical protein
MAPWEKLGRGLLSFVLHPAGIGAFMMLYAFMLHRQLPAANSA